MSELGPGDTGVTCPKCGGEDRVGTSEPEARCDLCHGENFVSPATRRAYLAAQKRKSDAPGSA